MIKSVSLLAMLALLLGVDACNGAVAAADVAPTVIVVDSSGSMAASERSGRIKLDAARDAVAMLVKDWPPGGELAMIAYGHRRTGDCADIETMLQMGKASEVQVKRSLMQLRPRGKTPLSQSLRQAASLLPPGGGTILLISDGLETCAADPCAVARDLKKAQPNLIIHVVGFGIARNEIAQLKCIAENASGKFFDADDAPALTRELGKAAVVIAQPPPPPAPPQPPPAAPAPPAAPPAPAQPPKPAPPPPPPQVTPPPAPAPAPPPPPSPKRVSLAAVAGPLGRIVEAPVRWTVKAAAGEPVYQGESRGLSLTLAPGTYTARAEASNAFGEKTFTIGADASDVYDVEVAAGRLALTLAANGTSQPFDDLEAAGVVWTLEPLDGQGGATIPPLAKPSLVLAPGRYVVKAKLKDLEAQAAADIVAGSSLPLTLNFQLGSLVLEAAQDDAGPPLDDPTMLSWRIGQGATAQPITGEARPKRTLQAGTHEVVLSIAGAEIPAKAEVVAGEERVARVIVGGGELALSAQLGGPATPLEDWRDATWKIEAISALGVAPGTVAAEVPSAEPRVPVTAGRWRVILRSGSVTAEREVAVAPGSVAPLVVDLAAARLTMNATPQSGEPSANVVFSVFALGADGAAEIPTFASGAQTGTSTIVAAGRWRVTAEDSDGRRAEIQLQLAAGEEKTLDLVLK